ncbi:MAG: hypothetical protein AAGB26_04540 [Planctomycetota bacterium]
MRQFIPKESYIPLCAASTKLSRVTVFESLKRLETSSADIALLDRGGTVEFDGALTFGNFDGSALTLYLVL